MSYCSAADTDANIGENRSLFNINIPEIKIILCVWILHNVTSFYEIHAEYIGSFP